MFELLPNFDAVRARLRVRSSAIPSPCVAYAGHDFEESEGGKDIFCRRCGDTRPLREDALVWPVIPPACVAWSGHRFDDARSGNALFCRACGTVRELAT